ncbi:MAG: hypothetical protein EOM84_03130, partial [Sphingobacteriia bacterium]|nr:hypothetical protein [Sphingobacteriia bacterium]
MLPYDPKIKEFAQKLRAGGMGYHEIAAAINEKFNESFDYSRAKNICRSACNGKRTLSPQKITEKQGATERKPKYEIIDDKYVIYFGKTKKLVATADELEKAFQLFCLADLTMNATALKMGWSREQFFAAKTSFDITKDAIPLLPETIDTLTADEISEKIRIAKKQYAIQKIHENKAKDIERDNKRFHDRNYLFSLAAERINAIDSSPFKVVNHKKADELYLLAISDVHAGMRINNRFSRYNLDIMRERFERVTAEILSLIKPCELTILDAGDLLAGGIHASVVKSSENPVDSLFSVTECYLKLCTTLMSKG